MHMCMYAMHTCKFVLRYYGFANAYIYMDIYIASFLYVSKAIET